MLVVLLVEDTKALLHRMESRSVLMRVRQLAVLQVQIKSVVSLEVTFMLHRHGIHTK